MAKEIERKFLVIGDWGDKSNAVHIDQGYLNIDPDKTVRVRIQHDIATSERSAFLTVKSRNIGIVRNEFEYEIPTSDAEQMLLMCVGLISKYRYTVWDNDLFWSVDVFTGGLELTLAEVELNSADVVIKTPDWIGKEVSDDWDYYNVNLATKKRHGKKSERSITKT